MKRISGLPMTTLVLMASGCLSGGTDGGAGGGGDGSGTPPPSSGPSAGGIWTGELTSTDGEVMSFRGLITESGEFRLVLNDQSQQIAGNFVKHGSDGISADRAEWDIEVWTDITLRGTIEERVSLTGEFETNFAPVAGGTFSFAYDDLYERDSSLALLAGTYTTDSESIAIDSQGVLFYQSSDTDCVGNGSVDLIETDFNMYRVALTVDNCTGDSAHLNGAIYHGLAHIGDSGDEAMNDTLQLATTTQGASCGLVCFFSWNLVARR